MWAIEIAFVGSEGESSPGSSQEKEPVKARSGD